MSPQIIAILIFVSVTLLLSVFHRKSTLDHLEMLEGEKVLFEESGVKVNQGGPFRGAVFFKCLIRVTDKRIIIAQRFVLSKNKYALKHVIGYNMTRSEIDLAETVKKSYLNLSVDKSNIRIEKDPNRKKEGYIFTIEIPQSSLTKSQYITYNTERSREYMDLLK